MADAYRVLSGIAGQRGDLEAVSQYDEKCLALYRQLGDLPRTAQACNNLADTYRLLGRMERAVEHLEKGLAIARRMGDVRDEAALLQTNGEVLLDQGAWQAGIAQLEQALVLAEESGEVAREIEVRWLLGAACTEAGHLQDARRHLLRADAQGRERGLTRFTVRIDLELARVEAEHGRFARAEQLVHRALELAETQSSEVVLGLVRRCQGYLCRCQEDWDGALAHWADSLDLLERTNLASEVAKARLDLGVGYASRGQRDDGGRAREHLLAARSFFQHIQAHGYLARVEAALAQLEAC
jgi:tetratricopeptide (TPR) repeat protein